MSTERRGVRILIVEDEPKLAAVMAESGQGKNGMPPLSPETLQRGAAELHRLVGDASHAHDRLGWQPELAFEQLAHLLVDADLERLRTPATSMER